MPVSWTRLCDSWALPRLPAHVFKFHPLGLCHHETRGVEASSFSEDNVPFLNLYLCHLSNIYHFSPHPTLGIVLCFKAFQQVLFCKCVHPNTRQAIDTDNKKEDIILVPVSASGSQCGVGQGAPSAQEAPIRGGQWRAREPLKRAPAGGQACQNGPPPGQVPPSSARLYPAGPSSPDPCMAPSRPLVLGTAVISSERPSQTACSKVPCLLASHSHITFFSSVLLSLSHYLLDLVSRLCEAEYVFRECGDLSLWLPLR